MSKCESARGHKEEALVGVFAVIVKSLRSFVFVGSSTSHSFYHHCSSKQFTQLMKTGSIYRWWKTQIHSVDVGLKIFFFWRLNFLYRIGPQWNEGGEKVQLSNCQNIAGPSKPKTCNVCHLLCTFSNWKARNIMSIYFVDNTNAIRSYENFLSIISRFMTFIICTFANFLFGLHTFSHARI